MRSSGGSSRDALAFAAEALRLRDLSRAALARRLAAAGLDATESAEAVDRLAADGYVDDLRLARSRAARLAGRGLGDAAIAGRLAEEGLGREEIEAALAELTPELDRACAIAASRRGTAPRRLAGQLTRRGFGAEAVASVLARLDDRDEAELP